MKKQKDTVIDTTVSVTVSFLEQDTGVEPAFTAWEAVVLPIYESCIAGIIAEGIGKFKYFLSSGQMWIKRI